MPERADGSARWVLRRTVKVALAGALTAAGVHRAVGAVRRWQAGGVRVLVVSYHRVTHDFEASAQEGLASLLVSAATLRRQLEGLARTREIVSLSEARRILQAPARPARRRRDVVAVTFDDGYADVHGVALPILQALRIPATAYVVTGYVGTARRLPHDRIFAALTELKARGLTPRQAGLSPPLQAALDACAGGPAATLDRLIARLPAAALLSLAAGLEARVGLHERDLPPGTRMMDWDEVRALADAGVEVGGHTVTHAVLPHLSPARARREVEGCRDELAARLGRAPRHFAYPNGYHSPALRRLVATCGFETAVTTEDRENRRGGDPLLLGRKMLWENTTLGPSGYSRALATCNLEGVFTALGLARPVPGEYSGAATPSADDPGGDDRTGQPRALARGAR